MEEDGLPSSRLPDERDRLAKDHVQVEVEEMVSMTRCRSRFSTSIRSLSTVMTAHGTAASTATGSRRSPQTASPTTRMPERWRRAVISDAGTGREKKYPCPSGQP